MRTSPEADALGDRIAEAIKAARKAAGLRQQDVAMAAGVSTRTITNIEQRNPGVQLNTLLNVLTALGLSLDIIERPVRRRRPARVPEDDE